MIKSVWFNNFSYTSFCSRYNHIMKDRYKDWDFCAFSSIFFFLCVCFQHWLFYSAFHKKALFRFDLEIISIFFLFFSPQGFEVLDPEMRLFLALFSILLLYFSSFFVCRKRQISLIRNMPIKRTHFTNSFFSRQPRSPRKKMLVLTMGRKWWVAKN